jgi:hypothetical protein
MVANDRYRDFSAFGYEMTFKPVWSRLRRTMEGADRATPSIIVLSMSEKNYLMNVRWLFI